MEKVFVIRQNYLMPHDSAPQNELYNTCYTDIEDAREQLTALYKEDKELPIFEDAEEDVTTLFYELSTDDYWSIAEIVELNKK